MFPLARQAGSPVYRESISLVYRESTVLERKIMKPFNVDKLWFKSKLKNLINTITTFLL